MNDTELLNWIEYSHAQIWHSSGLGKGWTVQVRDHPGERKFVQPTRNTLREAILAAAKGEK